MTSPSTPSPPAPGRRVAVIGAGISGLVAARLLSRQHSVTVFESAARIGGHTNTVDVDLDGERFAIDTGFIVYNERNYPNFTRLLETLGVASQPTSMSFAVKCERTGLEYNGSSLNQLFTQRRNAMSPRFLGMVRDILRFNREGPQCIESLRDDVSVDDFVREHAYGESFVEHYLVPLGASLWSSPSGTFRRFPIRFVLEFLHNHALLQLKGRPQWRVIRGGSREYIEPLIRPFADRVRSDCSIRSIRRHADGVEITLPDGSTASFDHAVLACHSDQALALLADPSDLERELLGAFPYQPNEAVLHMDPSVLPSRRRAWGAWNYHIPSAERDRVAITYQMNILQGLNTPHVFNVTLNDDGAIDPDLVLGRYTYHHPVFTARRADAQARHAELIEHRATSYCGAYWGYGFHEDGVRSALAVANAFGVTL